jgi:hypothetical protein
LKVPSVDPPPEVWLDEDETATQQQLSSVALFQSPETPVAVAGTGRPQTDHAAGVEGEAAYSGMCHVKASGFGLLHVVQCLLVAPCIWESNCDRKYDSGGCVLHSQCSVPQLQHGMTAVTCLVTQQHFHRPTDAGFQAQTCCIHVSEPLQTGPPRPSFGAARRWDTHKGEALLFEAQLVRVSQQEQQQQQQQLHWCQP